MVKHQQKQQRENYKELIHRLKKQCLKEISLKELIAPNGYADKIAKDLGKRVRISQLRKFFDEIKEICKLGREEPNKAQVRLWKLYPIIAYAEGRSVIDKSFSELLNSVLEAVDRCNTKEDYQFLEEFMTALVAYFKKYNPKG